MLQYANILPLFIQWFTGSTPLAHSFLPFVHNTHASTNPTSPNINNSEYLNSTTYHHHSNYDPHNGGKPAAMNDLGADLFGAGIALMIAGPLLKWLQDKVTSVIITVTDCRAQVTISSDEEAFTYVSEYVGKRQDIVSLDQSVAEKIIDFVRWDLVSLKWLGGLDWFGKSKSKGKGKQARSFICKTSYDNDDDDAFGVAINERDTVNRPNVFFIPNDGSYIISFKGHKLYLSVQTQKKGGSGNNSRSDRRHDTSSSSSLDKVVFLIKVFDTDHTIVYDFIKSCVDDHYDKQGQVTHCFVKVPNWGLNWTKICSRQPRPLSSVIMKKGVQEDLLKDIRSFLAAESFYRDRGIPYRRGYCFFGPPGTGKSSCIFALAGELKKNVCLINLSSGGLNDNELLSLLTMAPKSAFLVIEDVDVGMGIKPGEGLSNGRSAGKGDDMVKVGGSQVTLSGLLNALDGMAAQEGRIVFLTTNNISSLPPALLRPGRCDRRFYFPSCDTEMISRLYARFFAQDFPNGEPEALKIGQEIASRFESCIQRQSEDILIGAAQLQGYFMRFREDPREALNGVEGFVEELLEQRRDEIEGDRERVKLKEKEKEKEKEQKDDEESCKISDEMKGEESCKISDEMKEEEDCKPSDVKNNVIQKGVA
ncbi:mitochondrial chaperone [Blyttiomyces sp. JEL0837]|nr:mitochondrial chaperone [Blyttiomyces sp. JEL0837]